MIRLPAMLALLSVTVLISTAAHAERIKVTEARGGSLMDQCFQSSDARVVGTNKDTYLGCCSEALGYCILCSTSGECYKFIDMKSMNEFRRGAAPDSSGVVVDDEPVRPPRIIRKRAPDNGRVIE